MIAPLAIGIVELPLTVVRAPFSRTRWIEAVCREPAEIRILWKSSRRLVEQAKAETRASSSAATGSIRPARSSWA